MAGSTSNTPNGTGGSADQEVQPLLILQPAEPPQRFWKRPQKDDVRLPPLLTSDQVKESVRAFVPPGLWPGGASQTPRGIGQSHVTLSPRQTYVEGKGRLDIRGPWLAHLLTENSPNRPEGQIQFSSYSMTDLGDISVWLEGLVPEGAYLVQFRVQGSPMGGRFKIISVGSAYNLQVNYQEWVATGSDEVVPVFLAPGWTNRALVSISGSDDLRVWWFYDVVVDQLS